MMVTKALRSLGTVLFAAAILIPLTGCRDRECKQQDRNEQGDDNQQRQEQEQIKRTSKKQKDKLQAFYAAIKKHGMPFPLDPIEKALGPPNEIASVGRTLVRQVYREEGSKRALVVTLHRGEKAVLGAAVYTLNPSGKLPESIWSVAQRIRQGQKVSKTYIEQCFGPPVYKNEIDKDNQTEELGYQEKADPRYLLVKYNRQSRRAADALVLNPYNVSDCPVEVDTRGKGREKTRNQVNSPSHPSVSPPSPASPSK
ncbi:MAG: hypothetical protein WCB27_08555 [Thermoguttaceae bacterium]